MFTVPNPSQGFRKKNPLSYIMAFEGHLNSSFAEYADCTTWKFMMTG